MRSSRSSSHYRRNSNRDDSSSFSPDAPPFRDADTDIGETPLEELDTFVISATDEHGHGEHIHFKLPRYVLYSIKLLISSHRFPYLDTGYFFRHAAVRHIHWLIGLRESLPKHVRPALDAIMEVCRQDELKVSVERAFAKIEERAGFHLGRGDHGEAIRLLNLIKTKLEGVENSASQREVMKHFEQRWAPYLQGKTEVDGGGQTQ